MVCVVAAVVFDSVAVCDSVMVRVAGVGLKDEVGMTAADCDNDGDDNDTTDVVIGAVVAAVVCTVVVVAVDNDDIVVTA